MAQTYSRAYGYYLYYDDLAAGDLRYAIDYLSGVGNYSIDRAEADTLFQAARDRGEADFEDQYGGSYALKYDYSNKTYTVEKR